MSRTLLAALLVSASLAAATAQTVRKPQAQQPAAAAAVTPEAVLDRYVQALGGSAAIEKIGTRVVKGSYEIAGVPVKGELELYSKAPNMAVLTVTLPGLGVLRHGYDGQTGWKQDPVYGLRELKGAELASTKFDAEFNRELKLRQMLRRPEVKGAEKVAGRDAQVVVGEVDGLGPVKLYFDKQTGLLARMDINREDPTGKVSYQVYYDDYREVDGVKIPFTQRGQSSDFAEEIRLTSVKHNEPVEDAKFKKPSS